MLHVYPSFCKLYRHEKAPPPLSPRPPPKQLPSLRRGTFPYFSLLKLNYQISMAFPRSVYPARRQSSYKLHTSYPLCFLHRYEEVWYAYLPLISSSAVHRLDMTLAVAEELAPNKPNPC